ncbi:hypothetical protein PR202_gb19048 [Eleusine coracana subsp. coracana]|uniref:Late embryogenesis abundant protein LEA-2 subgroup domain-containing protein n=1 Tax=Eleusine coracana subsp. coracana TaxID=191504 RepID=A0AAV5F778_ELECO|nr:hypothetical protein QOZ80_3BG0289080 [Eleusine coracana subsp. coracana]GJN30717.1 hypothetical protein PR202_gb19048 [Eleusine coracana subsp. coracana]
MVMASATTNGAAAAAADEHEEVPLFHPSPCAQHYYVQSPSAASHTTLSHPAASDSMALILSPFPTLHHDHEEASRLTLSRYSSSRGSNTSFPAAAAGYDNDDDTKKPSRRRQTLTVLSNPSGGDDADDDHERRSGAWRYVKLDPDAPCCCIAFQVAWRVLASAAFALLVFVLATRPRRPGVSFRVGRVERFSLGEGVDGSGVETSFLDCNCSVDMVVENHSKVFGLRVRPPLLELSFGRFVFAASRGWDEGSSSATAHVVAPRAASTLRMFVAVKEKPMYAAGRGMQDMLESNRGLPLTVTVRARSRYRVVGSLVRLTYHHDSECVVYLRRSPRRNNDVVAAGRGTCSALR